MRRVRGKEIDSERERARGGEEEGERRAREGRDSSSLGFRAPRGAAGASEKKAKNSPSPGDANDEERRKKVKTRG
jgi:hypothetical protein